MLYILTPIFCVASVCGTVFSFSKTDKVYGAATPVKQSAAYLDLNGSGKILNGFEGAQKEYVYFGTNNEETVKWRVLSTGSDNKYGNGMLLWADKQITAEAYNPGGHIDFAYWGTSYLRAILSGGIYYPDTVTPDTIAESVSWYGKLFSGVEKSAVEAAGSYVTDNFGVIYESPDYLLKKTGIIENYDANGKYNTVRINETLNPTSKYAKVNGTGVQETTSGDKLFLLDYYDINNRNYGFVDSDGQTYVEKVTAYTGKSWNTASNWYPCAYDGGGAGNNGILCDYLDFPVEVSDFAWLRAMGHIDYSTVSVAIGFGGGGVGPGAVFAAYGVQPAFNLDTTKIGFVTTAKPASGWTDMSQTATKPEYRTYLKDTDYTANTNNAKALVGEKNGTLNIRYNNPTGKSGGKLVLLLSDKTKNDGSVAYQTAIAMNSTSATDNVFTTVTLPGSINYSDYKLTLMYTSDNASDANASETIYCSYATDSGIVAPSDINVTYANASKWIADLKGEDKPVWLDLNIYNNAAFMSVKTVEYTNVAGEKQTDKTYTTADIKNAGTYKVTMTLASGLKWSDGKTEDKSFTINIAQAESSIEAQYANAPTYVPDKLPAISLKSGGTPGTIAWDDGQVPKSGTKEYTWTFTPTDTNNYTEETGSKSFTFAAREVESVTIKSFNTNGKTVYTNTTDTVLKSYMTVEVKYVSFEETVTLDPGDYELQINSNNKLKTGDNKLKVKYTTSDNKVKYSAEFPISGVVELSYKTITNIVLSDDTFTYPVTASEILSKITSVDVEMNDGDSDSLTADQIAALMELDGSSDLTVGTKDVTFKIKDTDAETDYEITINKGDFDVSGITFTGDTVTYDESTHSIAYSGTLPDGVSVKYEYNGTKQDTPWEFTNAGTYDITLSFTHGNANYNAITTTLPATLTINKATVTGIVFEDAVKPEITGTTYTLEATGVPSWVEVEYYYNGAEFTGASAAGDYEITAKFTIDDDHAGNYEAISDITKTLTISDKPEVEGAGNIVVEPAISATYTGSPVDYSAKNVPNGVDVSYKIEKDGAEITGTDIINVGVYTVTVSFDTGAAYAPIASKTCIVTVGKATVDMDGVKFANDTVTGNGQPHKFEATNLPQGVTVEYEYKGNKQADPFEFTEVGEYTVKAHFTYEDEDNYEAIEPIEATLTISDAFVTGVSAVIEDGAKFDINNTLDDVIAKIKAEISYNNGTKESVGIEDLTVTCATLREGGLLEVGKQTITVTYNDGTDDFTTTVEIEVAKAKVALPVYNGSLKYTGDVVKPSASDFEGYDSALMALVENKTVAGLNAGAYKAVFALKDSERYEWATARTLKKTVFAAVVYEEVVLEDYEAAVDWNLAKAKITATKANGKLPVFASESYTGSFAEVVGLKYYTDETCAEEVAAEELGYSTKYFVKAELLDTANFELDETALTLSKTAFEYTTPEKQLTTWEKIVKFLSVNWLWLVIAVAALILLILIIALAARASKKKREREEQRRLEEKAERERKEEREEQRRREEREERMARLNQQQAMPQMMMPQMMQMPQMMGGQMPQMQAQQAPQPQYAPQPAPGASDAQFAQIQSELAAMRAEQAAMRTEVAMRAEQAAIKAEQSVMHSEIYAMRGGEQAINGGISLDKLTEIIRTEVKNAMANEKAAAQPAPAAPEAAPAAAQVPPDAVMTTVTTTKIDTTKKPVQQTAQAPAPVRTVVRNVVAPMPVDDGRVFDVGGFYTPVDPVTDMGFIDEDNKD